MKVLIDTQSIIWFAENNPQLSQKACAVIENVAQALVDNLAIISSDEVFDLYPITRIWK